MSNEIKVGDKVRVREDAPRILRKVIPSKVFEEESKVVTIDSEMAVVWTEPIHKNLIPTKYLVKVGVEKKEAKFKVGDVVRTVFNETTLITSVLENGNYYLYGMGNEYPEDSLTLVEPYTEPKPKFKVGDRVRVKGYVPNLHKGDIGEILDINDKEQCFVLFKKSQAWIYAYCLEPYTEPTEEKKDNTITIPVKVDLDDTFWDAYAADLAKEIAVKVANKYSDPKEAGDYAVLVAKAVVEGLKRK